MFPVYRLPRVTMSRNTATIVTVAIRPATLQRRLRLMYSAWAWASSAAAECARRASADSARKDQASLAASIAYNRMAGGSLDRSSESLD